jgi:hypothetical protein
VAGTGYVPPFISTHSSRIYRNDQGTFVNSATPLAIVTSPSLAWGDYDNDGDLDLLLSGGIAGGAPISKLYRNEGTPANTPPSTPGGLLTTVQEDSITFEWDAAGDGETPVAGLSYNLRVGTAPGLQDVFSGMANATTGYRCLPAIGNAQKLLSWSINDLPSGVYYWSAQAIDPAYAGSAWASEQRLISVFVRADFNHDGDVDGDDLSVFEACATGPAIPYNQAELPEPEPGCTLTPDGNGKIAADFDEDGDVDQSDFGAFQRCYSDEGNSADPGCAD